MGRRIYEADAFVDFDGSKEESKGIVAEAVLVEPQDESKLAELTVHYPRCVSRRTEGKTKTIYVPMSLIGGEVAAVSARAPIVKPEVVAPAPVEEDPALAQKKNAMREHLAALRAKMYAPPAPVEEEVPEAPVEAFVEAPVAEAAAEPVVAPLSFVAAAEQIIEEIEEEKIPVLAVATEEAAAMAERASELSAIVPLAYESPEEEIDPFDGIQSRTFEEKLAALPDEMRRRYESLNAYLATYERMRVLAGKKYRTYKSGNVPFLKMAIRGKTLSAYFALEPKEFEETKYIYTNEGESTAFENYPMRLRLSSDRQERWARELVDVIAKKNGIAKIPAEVAAELAEEAENGVFDPFAALKRKKQKTFKQKLRAGTKELRARYKGIKAHIETIDRVRAIESNKSETYKRGSIPIAKLTVKGKTLNAYLALPPSEFAETKYKFLDASEIKAYEKYPMRVKITSDRQERWAKELVDEIVARQNLKKK